MGFWWVFWMGVGGVGWMVRRWCELCGALDLARIVALSALERRVVHEFGGAEVRRFVGGGC
ncbi:Uncharacterised protein [Dermatophilus congolensis]|uniref:Uncharacterized protein n=1 Tax=Dermatophilus congolensis TaxID=1863 RepID=A0AA46H1J4_9MICO|nr:Uncharacterised protein [Dermatophilus congolensis]